MKVLELCSKVSMHENGLWFAMQFLLRAQVWCGVACGATMLLRHRPAITLVPKCRTSCWSRPICVLCLAPALDMIPGSEHGDVVLFDD